MKNSKNESFDHIALEGLHGRVPEEHVRKINQLVEMTKKEFEGVFGNPKSNEDTTSNIVGIQIEAWSDEIPDRQVVSIALSERTPIDSGPKPRKPIRCGGGKCTTIKIGKYTYTICIDWEGPC